MSNGIIYIHTTMSFLSRYYVGISFCRLPSDRVTYPFCFDGVISRPFYVLYIVWNRSYTIEGCIYYRHATI